MQSPNRQSDRAVSAVMGFAGVLLVVLTIAASVLGLGVGLVDSLNQDFTVSADDVNIQVDRTGDPANNTVRDVIRYGDSDGDAPILQPGDYTEIVTVCSDGTRTVVADGNETIEPGDILAYVDTLGCPPGDTIQIVIVTPDGSEEVIGQVNVPTANDETFGTGDGGATADGDEDSSSDGTIGFIIESITIDWASSPAHHHR